MSWVSKEEAERILRPGCTVHIRNGQSVCKVLVMNSGVQPHSRRKAQGAYEAWGQSGPYNVQAITDQSDWHLAVDCPLIPAETRKRMGRKEKAIPAPSARTRPAGFCELVQDENCLAPIVQGGRKTTAVCFCCGRHVCTSCSHRIQWYTFGVQRICPNCAWEGEKAK